MQELRNNQAKTPATRNGIVATALAERYQNRDVSWLRAVMYSSASFNIVIALA
jgi:hypothetical protein